LNFSWNFWGLYTRLGTPAPKQWLETYFEEVLKEYQTTKLQRFYRGCSQRTSFWERGGGLMKKFYINSIWGVYFETLKSCFNVVKFHKIHFKAFQKKRLQKFAIKFPLKNVPLILRSKLFIFKRVLFGFCVFHLINFHTLKSKRGVKKYLFRNFFQLTSMWK
jgi:hypothetical protein